MAIPLLIKQTSVIKLKTTFLHFRDIFQKVPVKSLLSGETWTTPGVEMKGGGTTHGSKITEVHMQWKIPILHVDILYFTSLSCAAAT